MDIKKEIISWIITLAAAAAIAMLIRHFLFEPVRVEGRSMENTLIGGEIMFVTKPEYLFGVPQRQDVVICRYPNRKENFVKRLIGLPGDTIEMRGTKVFINGEELTEVYLTDSNNRYDKSMQPIVLGDDDYFVMGDNRDNSNDSRARAVGFLSRSQIIGHVRCVVFPFGNIRVIK